MARLVALGQLAQKGLGLNCLEAVACSSTSLLSSFQGGAAQTTQVRHFAAPHGSPPDLPPNPLQNIVPVIIKAVPATINAAVGAVKSLTSGVAGSSQVKQLVTNFGDNVIVGEMFLGLKDVDVAKWSSWLAGAGYRNQAGWAKIVDALKPKAASLTPAEVATVLEALETAGVYDKELYTSLAGVVKERFTEFETEAAAQAVSAFATFDHYDNDLFDDIADTITYANHYLAPVYLPVTVVSKVLGAYAKFAHDRTDLFVLLARAVTEDKLLALDSDVRRDTVLTLLKAFEKFEFWPDVTEGLFLVVDNSPAVFSETDTAYVKGLVSKVEALAGGALPYYKEGFKDPAHYHGPAFGDYNLWVFRNSLLPSYYSPTAVKAWKQ